MSILDDGPESSWQGCLQRWRALDLGVGRAHRAASSEDALGVWFLQPVLLNDRLVARDRYEMFVLASRLPRTLLGRGPTT